MSILEAAEKVLREAGGPLSGDVLTQRMVDAGLWTPVTKTPSASVRSAIYVHIKKGGRTFVKVGKGMFGLAGMAANGHVKSNVRPAKVKQSGGDSGYVYILTNPSFRKDWVKIGMTERPVNVRSKELDNTAVPLPFEIYATLKTKHRQKIEGLLHGMIDDIDPGRRIRKSREFFNIKPDVALKLLVRAARVFDEEENISQEFQRLHSKVASSHKAVAAKKQVASRTPAGGETWSGKTQLAKLIATRGGNVGAFGGILQYFSQKRSCPKGNKWRQLLEDAGIKFDANDFVIDWSAAKNPLPQA